MTKNNPLMDADYRRWFFRMEADRSRDIQG